MHVKVYVFASVRFLIVFEPDVFFEPSQAPDAVQLAAYLVDHFNFTEPPAVTLCVLTEKVSRGERLTIGIRTVGISLFVAALDSTAAESF